MRQRSGTTLVEALPPSIRPTFAVVRSSIRPRRIAAHGRGGRRDRAAALLRPDAGVGGRAVELGLEAVVGRRGDDHLADRRWRGRTRSRTPTRSGEASNALAPRSAFSSQTVNSSSTPTGGRCCHQRAAPAPAAPRRPPCCRRRGSPRGRSPRPPSTSTGSIGACGHDRVEVGAQQHRPRASPGSPIAGQQVSALRAGRRGRRRPRRPRGRASRSSAATRSAHARSWPNGLSIRHSAAKRSLRRARSGAAADVTAARG